jgi:hypothetical protein
VQDAGVDRRAAKTDWGRCESRHQKERFNKELGSKRPMTGWDESKFLIFWRVFVAYSNFRPQAAFVNHPIMLGAIGGRLKLNVFGTCQTFYTSRSLNEALIRCSNRKYYYYSRVLH